MREGDAKREGRQGTHLAANRRSEAGLRMRYFYRAPASVWVGLAPNIAFQHSLLSQRRASVASTPLVDAVRKKKSHPDAKL